MCDINSYKPFCLASACISTFPCTCMYRHSRIGTLYFDSEKLKDWSAASQQTMALFERIRTVGKGDGLHVHLLRGLNTLLSRLRELNIHILYRKSVAELFVENILMKVLYTHMHYEVTLALQSLLHACA